MKRITLSLIISLGIILLGALINYIYYRLNRHMLLCIRHFGGEITIESAFGLIFRHIYAMRPEDRDSLSIRFEPILFVIWFLAIAVFVYLILFVVGKIRKK